MAGKEPAGSRPYSLSSSISGLCLETLVGIISLNLRLISVLFSESKVTKVNHNSLKGGMFYNNKSLCWEICDHVIWGNVDWITGCPLAFALWSLPTVSPNWITTVSSLVSLLACLPSFLSIASRRILLQTQIPLFLRSRNLSLTKPTLSGLHCFSLHTLLRTFIDVPSFTLLYLVPLEFPRCCVLGVCLDCS